MRITRIFGLCLLIGWGANVAWSLAQEEGKKPVQRAKRPSFSDRQVETTYFKDIFRDALVGERPILGREAMAGQAAGEPGGANPASTGRQWSNLVASEVIENEIKALKINSDQTITTPVKFAGGGYQDARRDFSELAMLFAIINEFDGEVRWRDDAASLRDTFARSAANAKTGSQQTYQEAKQRKQDLQDIVGGNAFVGTKTTEPDNDWSNICDRSPVMERLQMSIELIKPAISNAATFESEASVVRHEASLIAAMGQVLTMEGMDDAIEEDYVVYAREMRDAAVDVVAAVKSSNYDNAVKAVGTITKACSNCHDDWQ